MREDKIKVLFCCHGNICRSPICEFVMKDLVEKRGIADKFYIESAATSREELGNPVYPPAKKKLAEHGISCEGKTARQMTAEDYDKFDMIICMDNANVRNALRLFDGDPEGKVSMLMDYTETKGREVADPWYTGDFDATWRDAVAGCTGLIEYLMKCENSRKSGS